MGVHSGDENLLLCFDLVFLRKKTLYPNYVKAETMLIFHRVKKKIFQAISFNRRFFGKRIL